MTPSNVPSWVYAQMGVPLPVQAPPIEEATDVMGPIATDTIPEMTPGDAVAFADALSSPPPPVPMQPGLGIPQAAVDSLLPAFPPGSPGSPPGPVGSSGMTPAFGPQLAPTEGTSAPSDAPVTSPVAPIPDFPDDPGAPAPPTPYGARPTTVSQAVGPISVDRPPMSAVGQTTGPMPAPVPVQVPSPPITDADRTRALGDAIDSIVTRPIYATLGPDGSPETSLSPEDLAFKAVAQSDQVLKMRLSSLQASGSLAIEQARRSAPSIEAYNADAMRITNESDAEVRRMLSEVRRGYDEAREAADEANSRFPNPDDLMGGAGSWSRALSLGIMSAYAGLPGSSIAQTLDQQMRLQYAGMQSRYQGSMARADALSGLAQSQAAGIKGISEGYNAMLDSARNRLAAGLQRVSNGLAEPGAKLAVANAATELYDRSSRDRLAYAKDMADIRLKGAQEQEALGKALKARGVGMGGPAREVPAGDLKRGVWGPDGTWLPFAKGVKLSDPDSRLVSEYNRTYQTLDANLAELQSLANAAGRARSTGGQVWDRWKTVNERRYDALANEVATQLAKLRDPDSAAREGEVRIERGNLPDLSTFLGMEGDAVDGLTSDLRARAARQYRFAIDGRLGKGFADRFIQTSSQRPVDERANPPVPSSDDMISRAQSAYSEVLARPGASKQDLAAAAAALDEARRHKAKEETVRRESRTAERSLAEHGPPPQPLNKTGMGAPDIQAAISSYDTAAAIANQKYSRYLARSNDIPRKGGDVLRTQEYNIERERLGRDAAAAVMAQDDAAAKLASALARDEESVRIIRDGARALGVEAYAVDPTTGIVTQRIVGPEGRATFSKMKATQTVRFFRNGVRGNTLADKDATFVSPVVVDSMMNDFRDIGTASMTDDQIDGLIDMRDRLLSRRSNGLLTDEERVHLDRLLKTNLTRQSHIRNPEDR